MGTSIRLYLLIDVMMVMMLLHFLGIRGGGFIGGGASLIVTGAGSETNDGKYSTTGNNEGFHNAHTLQ